MIVLGQFCELEVSKKVEFGYYLKDQFGDEVLLPKNSCEGKKVEEGDTIEAFVYRDTKDRMICTLKKPYITSNEVGYLEIVSQTKIGAFADIGLERDLFIPLKEQPFKLKTGQKYLISMYIDKSDRLAGTLKIGNYLEKAEEGTYKVGDEVAAVAYETNERSTWNVAVDKKYKGLILANEHFDYIYPGEEIKGRVKTIYEDGTIGITTRKKRLDAREEIEEKILKMLEEGGGFMPFNDKSSAEDIRLEFGTSKNYFKMSLGGLMKKGLITQDKEGTRLIKK